MEDILLSRHVLLSEFVRTSHTQFNEWQMHPPPHVVPAAKRLCEDVYEPICDAWGAEPVITSGFRSMALNKFIGGAQLSAHLFGRAMDIVPSEKRKPLMAYFDMLRVSDVPYDKAILEHKRHSDGRTSTWIHVQVRRQDEGPCRRRALMSCDGAHYEPFNPRDSRALALFGR